MKPMIRFCSIPETLWQSMLLGWLFALSGTKVRRSELRVEEFDGRVFYVERLVLSDRIEE